MPSLIELTGKETKQDLIRILCEAKPKYEKHSVWDDPHYYRGESKPQLLRHVKIYNANVAAGGDGNLSRYFNDEAHSHRAEIDIRLRDYLLNEHGITQDHIKETVPQDEGLKAMGTWQQYLKDEHNDFIGHTQQEKDKAFEFMKALFLNLLKLNK